MNRRRLFFIFFLSLLLGMLLLPTILRAIPSRYVARLPEPLQRLGAPEVQASILPTVVVDIDAGILLGTAPGSSNQNEEKVESTQVDPPATPTPPQISDRALENSAMQIPSPTLQPSPTMMPTATPSPIPIPSAFRLEGFRHIFQTWNNCGPATLAMTLSYFDMGLTQDQTAAVLKPNPEDRNVSPYEMVDYVENETPYHAINRVNGDIDTIRRLVANEIPVILEIGIDPPGEFRWLGWYGHYLLVVAYDDSTEQFWVYDSWFGTSEEPLKNAHPNGRILPYDVVDEYWPHFNRNYIAVFLDEQAELVAEIIGAEMDDSLMWQNALSTVRSETAVATENAFLWFNLGTIYNALGQYDQAALAFDQARAIGLPWRMLWYQFGPYEAYYEVGRYEDVILLADLTLKDRPYFEESYYYKGLAQERLGNLADAQDNFEKAVNFNPHFSPAVMALQAIGNS